MSAPQYLIFILAFNFVLLFFFCFFILLLSYLPHTTRPPPGRRHSSKVRHISLGQLSQFPTGVLSFWKGPGKRSGGRYICWITSAQVTGDAECLSGKPNNSPLEPELAQYTILDGRYDGSECALRAGLVFPLCSPATYLQRVLWLDGIICLTFIGGVKAK